MSRIGWARRSPRGGGQVQHTAPRIGHDGGIRGATYSTVHHGQETNSRFSQPHLVKVSSGRKTKFNLVSSHPPGHHPADLHPNGTHKWWRAIRTSGQSRLASASAEGGVSSRVGVSPPTCQSPRSRGAQLGARGPTQDLRFIVINRPRKGKCTHQPGPRKRARGAPRRPAPAATSARHRCGKRTGTLTRATLGGCWTALTCARRSVVYNRIRRRRADRGTCATQDPQATANCPCRRES